MNKPVLIVLLVMALLSMTPQQPQSLAQDALPTQAVESTAVTDALTIITDDTPISQELALILDVLLSTNRRSEQMQVLMLLGIGSIVVVFIYVLDRAGRRTSDSVQPSVVEMLLKTALEFALKQSLSTTTTLDENMIRHAIQRAGYEEAADGTLRRRPTASEVAAQAYAATPDEIDWLKAPNDGKG